MADSAVERNELRIGSGFGSITDLKIGPDGQLYVLSLGQGAIYRLPEPSVGAGWAAGAALLGGLSVARRKPRR